MNIESAKALVASRPWWYHKFEIFPGVWTPGVYDPAGTLFELQLPADMTGMRVLEIGPADGYFTKVMTGRGARVVAADYAAKDHYGFAVMERLAGVSYDFRQINLFDLPRHELGRFDLIICLGVLYHLPDPLLGLYTLSCIDCERFILETFVTRKYDGRLVAEYLPGASQNGDYTNFWAPSPDCCEAMLADVGFRTESTFLNDTRAMFRCRADRSKLPTKKMRVAYTSIEH